MKKFLGVATLMLAVLVGFLPNGLLAQEAEQPAAQEAVEPAAEVEETEFSYGTVTSVSSNQIVVSEYDYESDQDVDVTYTVPADVKLEGVASLQEIAVGDAIDIDFLIKGGQKVASLITVEKPIEEDEEGAFVVEDEETGAT